MPILEGSIEILENHQNTNIVPTLKDFSIT